VIAGQNAAVAADCPASHWASTVAVFAVSGLRDAAKIPWYGVGIALATAVAGPRDCDPLGQSGKALWAREPGESPPVAEKMLVTAAVASPRAVLDVLQLAAVTFPGHGRSANLARWLGEEVEEGRGGGHRGPLSLINYRIAAFRPLQLTARHSAHGGALQVSRLDVSREGPLN
jgi:hypothetical protein